MIRQDRLHRSTQKSVGMMMMMEAGKSLTDPSLKLNRKSVILFCSSYLGQKFQRLYLDKLRQHLVPIRSSYPRQKVWSFSRIDAWNGKRLVWSSHLEEFQGPHLKELRKGNLPNLALTRTKWSRHKAIEGLLHHFPSNFNIEQEKTVTFVTNPNQILIPQLRSGPSS